MEFLIPILLIAAVIAVCYIGKLFETDEHKIERRKNLATKKNFYNLGVALVRVRGKNDVFRDGEVVVKTISDTDDDVRITVLSIWHRESLVYRGAGAESGMRLIHTYRPGKWESVLLRVAHQARHQEEVRYRNEESQRRREEAQRKRDELKADKRRFGL